VGRCLVAGLLAPAAAVLVRVLQAVQMVALCSVLARPAVVPGAAVLVGVGEAGQAPLYAAAAHTSGIQGQRSSSYRYCIISR
jgi:hypothetical protein